jgi:hypothetical protein
LLESFTTSAPEVPRAKGWRGRRGHSPVHKNLLAGNVLGFCRYQENDHGGALEQDADAVKAAAAARHAAKVTLDLTTRQMQVGYVSYLTMLSAEQTDQQALINVVQAQSNSPIAMPIDERRSLGAPRHGYGGRK